MIGPFLSSIIGYAAFTSTGVRADEPRLLLIKGARIFDGVSVYPKASVVVADGKISSLTIADPPDYQGAEVIDGTGKTLLPGLIDCHAHAMTPRMLIQAAVFGVTTELDMFTVNLFAKAMRAGQAAGRADDRADLFSAGTLITAPGGHGTQFGIPIPTITKPEEAQAFVDARIAEGSDYIKIAYDTGSELGIDWPHLSKETLRAIIDASHKRGKLALVHVLALEEARTAIELGADGLVHVFIDQPADDAFIALAASKQTFIIPTLTVIESVTGVGGAAIAEDPELNRYLGPISIKLLRSTFVGPKGKVPEEAGKRAVSVSMESVRRLHKAGVSILAGTDSIGPGSAHGASLHRELELLVDAGLTPLEAISGATALASNKIRILGSRGHIRSGDPADLVLVNGDPFTNIKATRSIAGVWKHGTPIDREGFQKSIADEKPDDSLNQPKSE